MPSPEPAAAERLQKVLAAAGLGSRRACEELIAAGRVTVDGRVATLGDRADPVHAEIHVDGARVVTDTTLVYLAMNKPRGVVSTMDDERGRAALADYVADLSQRVYHVGRLDADSEGLLLLTNDGTLAHRLMHPSFGVSKTYLAEVGYPVSRLVRTAIGPIKLGGLKPGRHRRLNKAEVAALFAAVGEGKVSQAADHPAGSRARPGSRARAPRR